MTSDTVGLAVHPLFLSGGRVSHEGRVVAGDAEPCDTTCGGNLRAAAVRLLSRLSKDAPVDLATPVWCTPAVQPDNDWWSDLPGVGARVEAASGGMTGWIDVVRAFLADVVPNGGRVAAVDDAATYLDVVDGRAHQVGVGVGTGIIDSFVRRFAGQYLTATGAVDHTRLVEALAGERPGSGGVVLGLGAADPAAGMALTGLSYQTTIEQVLASVLTGVAAAVAEAVTVPPERKALFMWCTHPTGTLLARHVAIVSGAPVLACTSAGTPGVAVAAVAARRRGVVLDATELRRAWPLVEVLPDKDHSGDHAFCQSVGRRVTDLIRTGHAQR